MQFFLGAPVLVLQWALQDAPGQVPGGALSGAIFFYTMVHIASWDSLMAETQPPSVESVRAT